MLFLTHISQILYVSHTYTDRKSLSHMSTWTNETLLSQHITEYDVGIEYLGQNVRVIADLTY